MSLEDFSKEWNHFDLTYILWFLWFGIPESSSTQEHQLNGCWHSWKHPESVHRRFIQHCYYCYLVQVANTESFITIWGKKNKTGLNIKMKRETTSNWFWKADNKIPMTCWRSAAQRLINDLSIKHDRRKRPCTEPKMVIQFERKMSQIDEELLSLHKELPTHPFGTWFELCNCLYLNVYSYEGCIQSNRALKFQR